MDKCVCGIRHAPMSQASGGKTNGQASDYKQGHSMQFDPGIVSEQDIRREKDKARRLRQTQWWLRKVHKGVCHYCNKEVGKSNLTMDHIVPLSRGGKSTKGNVVPACKECNTKKKYLLPIEWEEYIRALSEMPVTET